MPIERTEAVATAAQLRYTNTSSVSPNTIAPTEKLMTVNPITRRRLIPAIAKTGNAQNGWIMLASCSPMQLPLRSRPETYEAEQPPVPQIGLVPPNVRLRSG